MLRQDRRPRDDQLLLLLDTLLPLPLPLLMLIHKLLPRCLVRRQLQDQQRQHLRTTKQALCAIPSELLLPTRLHLRFGMSPSSSVGRRPLRHLWPSPAAFTRVLPCRSQHEPHRRPVGLRPMVTRKQRPYRPGKINCGLHQRRAKDSNRVLSLSRSFPRRA